MDSLANLVPVDSALAEAAMRYKWPTKPDKVALHLKAVSLSYAGSGVREISAAMGLPARKVSTMLEVAASIAHEIKGIGDEFKVIPYRYLVHILLAHGNLMPFKRGQPQLKFDFSTIDKVRELFSVFPPTKPSGFPRDGIDVVRKALCIEKPPFGARKVSHSATTIKAAIAVVECNFADPLVQAAVARWCTVL